jgi:hypothetical protein
MDIILPHPEFRNNVKVMFLVIRPIAYAHKFGVLEIMVIDHASCLAEIGKQRLYF